MVGDSVFLIHSFHISADDALHVHTASKRRCKYFVLQDHGLKDLLVNMDIQGMTVIDISNLSDTKRLFDDLKKYESFTSEDWRQRSIIGEVCAMAGCSNPPKNQCPKCYVHYCYEHVKNHYHRLKDEEIERSEKEEEGLK